MNPQNSQTIETQHTSQIISSKRNWYKYGFWGLILVGMFILIFLYSRLPKSYWNDIGKGTIIFGELTPVPSSTPTQDDQTSNWKTYTNKTFNYSFLYPEDWEVFRQTNDDSVMSMRQKGTENIPIILNAHINSENLSADQIINSQVGENYSKQKRIFNNIEWTYYHNDISSLKNDTYITIEGSNYYQAGVSTLFNNKYIPTFEKILSTFKFIE